MRRLSLWLARLCAAVLATTGSAQAGVEDKRGAVVSRRWMPAVGREASRLS
jgi:hypothetical protein